MEDKTLEQNIQQPQISTAESVNIAEPVQTQAVVPEPVTAPAQQGGAKWLAQSRRNITTQEAVAMDQKAIAWEPKKQTDKTTMFRDEVRFEKWAEQIQEQNPQYL